MRTKSTFSVSLENRTRDAASKLNHIPEMKAPRDFRRLLPGSLIVEVKPPREGRTETDSRENIVRLTKVFYGNIRDVKEKKVASLFSGQPQSIQGVRNERHRES